MKKLKVGIVGCGRISVMHKIAMLSLSDKADVVLAVDKDIDKAKAFAKDFECEAVESFDEVLRKDIDVLHLCTPHFLHAPQAIKAMNAGINVLTEKPMAITLGDADEMIRVSEITGRRLGVMFQSRYEAGLLEMKRLISQGVLGKITGAWSVMNWSRPPAYYVSDWKGTWRGEGGGLLIDQTIHTIDMVQWLINSRVVSVNGHIDNRVLRSIEVEDVADALIEFENGCRYSMYACNYHAANSPIEFEILGENGKVKLIGDHAYIHINGKPDYDVASAPSEEYTGEKYWGNFHKLQISDYYDSVLNGENPRVDGAAGRAALEIVLAVYSSSGLGKAVSLPLRESDEIARERLWRKENR